MNKLKFKFFSFHVYTTQSRELSIHISKSKEYFQHRLQSSAKPLSNIASTFTSLYSLFTLLSSQKRPQKNTSLKG